jgi:hypothetical protein
MNQFMILDYEIGRSTDNWKTITAPLFVTGLLPIFNVDEGRIKCEQLKQYHILYDFVNPEIELLGSDAMSSARPIPFTIRYKTA